MVSFLCQFERDGFPTSNSKQAHYTLSLQSTKQGDNSMKYKEWLNIWLNNYIKPSNKQRTFELYNKIVYIHILPSLGNFELTDLTPIVLQKFITDLTIGGNKRTGKGLSPSFVKIILSIIQSSLKMAHVFGYLHEYTAHKVKYPKVVEKQVASFTIQEQKKIENYVLNSGKDKLFGIILCLYTGMRIGELLALTWSDIDFEKSILSITKTCYDGNINGEHVRIIDSPKTENSRRQIPLSKMLVKMLKKIKKKSKCEFIVADGEKPCFVRSYQRTFELLLKKLKIPHKGFHSLRHTFATRALECGMDVKSLSEILGHKNATITLNRYAHSLWEHKAEMMNKLSKLL